MTLATKDFYINAKKLCFIYSFRWYDQESKMKRGRSVWLSARNRHRSYAHTSIQRRGRKMCESKASQGFDPFLSPTHNRRTSKTDSSQFLLFRWEGMKSTQSSKIYSFLLSIKREYCKSANSYTNIRYPTKFSKPRAKWVNSVGLTETLSSGA